MVKLLNPEFLPALQRLFHVVERHTGQSRHVAALLLSLYNGERFAFDLTSLRALDDAIVEDCLTVLRADAMRHMGREVHNFHPQAGRAFEQWAQEFRIPDQTRTVSALKAMLDLDAAGLVDEGKLTFAQRDGLKLARECGERLR